MRSKLIVVCWLSTLALSTLFSDIFNGMIDSQKPSISNFIKGLPSDIVNELKGNEQQAGNFICSIMQGNIPDVINTLAGDVWTEIEGDWSDIKGFILNIPTLAPQILGDIVQDGEDVVSVIGEVFTNPGGVLTLIENGAEEVVSDIESVGGEVLTGFECFFGVNCPSATTAADPVASLSLSCQAILAAATTAYATTQSTSTYQSAAATTYVSVPPVETSQLLDPTAVTSTVQPPTTQAPTLTTSASASSLPQTKKQDAASFGRTTRTPSFYFHICLGSLLLPLAVALVL